MPSDAHTIRAHELIGLRATVESALNKRLTGIQGTIVDETKNTIRIQSGPRHLTIAKSGTDLQLELESGEKLLVHGDQLTFRPEDRVKRGLGRWQ